MRLHLFLLLPLTLFVGNSQADDPAGMLSRFTGAWQTTVEARPAKWNPEVATATVQESTQSALKGKFIIGREHSQPDGRKSLWLMTHDAQRDCYPFWIFDSDGVLGGQWELKWDESSQTARGRSIDTPPGWTSGGSNHFPDRDTNEVEVWMRDETGALLMDVHSQKKRRRDAEGEVILAAWSKSEAPANRPTELKILDAFVGTWDAVTIARPAEWTPVQTQMNSVVIRQWILNDRFLMDTSKHDNGQESLSVFGYDPVRQEYRTWWFSSEGHQNSSHGTWDPRRNTFSFETRLEEGRVSRSTIRLINPDKHEWTIKVTDETGKLFFDSTITTTRRLP